MTQLGNVNQTVPALLPLLASVCLIVGMVVGLLGIKIWWFKHRLTFDQNSKRNGVAGNSQLPFGSAQRGRMGNSNASLQVDGATQIHGVFRKRQEDEWDIERPAVLPPVRLSKSTSDLKLIIRNTKVENELSTPINTSPSTSAPKLPVRKRKEIHSTAFEELTPPTREPPRPPQGISEEASIPTFDEFTAQFERVRIKNNVDESELTMPLLPTMPPPEMSTNYTLPSIELASENDIPFESIETTTQNVEADFQPKKFTKAKTPASETDLKKISQRRVTGFLPPDLEVLHAMNADDQSTWSGPEAVTLRTNPSQANDNERIEQRGRNSYVEYEKVDEFDSSLDFLLRKKWEDVETIKPVEHNDAIGQQFPAASNNEHIDDNPVTLDLFEDLEDTNVDRTVEHLWLKIEQNNEQHLDTNFRMIRHSYEMNEADILDVRPDRTAPQEDELVTTPTGFGKSIDEDWDNFENLSMIASAEQIFEPRMEQINVPVATYADRSTTHVDTLFDNLEIPFGLAPEEEGATALFVDQKASDTMDAKLPDYESIMAHDTTQFLLPDYEDAIKIESNLNQSSKQSVNYVSSIEDLFDELLEVPQVEKLTKTNHTDTAYITNIDELYEDLGLVHKSSVRFPTESYLDAKSELTLNGTKPFIDENKMNDTGIAPQPAQRRTKTRLKVRFDIESSQYYQPNELEPQSDSEQDDYTAPKPMLRTIRLHTEDISEVAPSSSNSMKTPMLFGSQLTNCIEEFEDDVNKNESWQAISQHRAMAEQFQNSCEDYTQDMPETTTRQLPKPAYRNPLAQVLVDNRPIAAVRKTSSASAERNDERQFATLLDNRPNEAEA